MNKISDPKITKGYVILSYKVDTWVDSTANVNVIVCKLEKLNLV